MTDKTESQERETGIILTRVCEHCNTGFKVQTHFGGSNTEVVNFTDCPHCDKRNDIWVSIEIGERITREQNVTAELGFALRLIIDERKRQIEKEGYDDQHDDAHGDNSLSSAAACYAIPERRRTANLIKSIWPWAWENWKPSADNRLRELAKSGALILAEIERIKRDN